MITGATQQQRIGGRSAVFYALQVSIALSDPHAHTDTPLHTHKQPQTQSHTPIPISFTINRRFSKFVALHGQLMEELPTTMLPSLPQVTVWSSAFKVATSTEVVSDRVLLLQTYLSALLERDDTKRAEALFEFLELNSCFQLLARLATES
mmetsp:Transcript_51180/g.82778  ORF Transcript_51180/g.82778 Transcript_51180/m.82778 type:complete len:150 (+) Transcript_51180:3-452(+)